MANTKARTPPSRAKDVRTPLIEWILGGIGIVLLGTCIAFLVYEGVNDGEEPGEITTSVVETVSAGDRHVVTFRIHNSGSQTLSNLQVSARLLDGDREVERATTTLDYLPGGSTKEGGFYFNRDPRELRLEIRPEGYQKP
jgi:uncharacterized protein (TIGR02588 family)